MLTNMPLFWVQYWTALPVVVEDRVMSDRSHSGGRVSSGAERLDTVPQHRSSDREDGASRGTSFTRFQDSGKLSSSPVVLTIKQPISQAVTLLLNSPIAPRKHSTITLAARPLLHQLNILQHTQVGHSICLEWLVRCPIMLLRNSHL